MAGRKIIEQYLDDDLYETLIVDDSFSQSTFLLSKTSSNHISKNSHNGHSNLMEINYVGMVV